MLALQHKQIINHIKSISYSNDYPYRRAEKKVYNDKNPLYKFKKNIQTRIIEELHRVKGTKS